MALDATERVQVAVADDLAAALLLADQEHAVTLAAVRHLLGGRLQFVLRGVGGQRARAVLHP
ncbi:hypothetical protein ACFVLG_34675, partial [Streptomyces rochei]|uniref:hypothetical protein n=1 Tax=Streptomyces rochei TaxID=1928 RepID=UPI003698D95B